MPAGKPYYFRHVNIRQSDDGTTAGRLVFLEADGSATGDAKQTIFWARSIIVENKGEMLAGTDSYVDPTTGATVTLKPFGSSGGTLQIVLYGADQTVISAFSAGNPKANPPTGPTFPQAQNSGISVPCTTPATIQPPGGQSPVSLGPCGIPLDTWTSNGSGKVSLPPILPSGDPSQRTGLFYQYAQTYLDDAPDPNNNNAVGYFSYKSIGLSYGGKLRLVGFKGTALADDTKPDFPGSSWVRLSNNVKASDRNLKLDPKNPNRPGDPSFLTPSSQQGLSDWQIGDEVIVTSTDYMPGHSEVMRITNVVSASEIEVERADLPSGNGQGLQFAHNGTRFNVAALLTDASDTFKNGITDTDSDPNDASAVNPSVAQSAETRASVALLTRSIRILSGGDGPGETFDDATYGNAAKGVPAKADYQFGGQVIFRQGFDTLQIQGVEFRQLGVGGRLAHYPVHFHMARDVPPNTWIKDSSINESMTRWVVLHSTLNVTLQRNVGWKSIGHGFFLESGAETTNRFYSNIGILARAAVLGPLNDRTIPGILADNVDNTAQVRGRSDVMHPTVFWITNGWNDFVGNMAVGTGACGACFWLHNMFTNGDMVDAPYHDPAHRPPMAMARQNWSGFGYSARPGGESPVRTFFRNYCSSAMTSLNTVTDPSPCGALIGQVSLEQATFQPPDPNAGKPSQLTPVPSYAPPATTATADVPNDMYYPNIGGNRTPTVCAPGDTGCNIETVAKCDNSAPDHCAITIVDHYTSSFNFAETNFSAVWLRTPGWFLYDHSFLSDVQSAGLTFVSGGDYTRSSAPAGLWQLASHSIFVGATQPQQNDPSGEAWSTYADVRGPFNPMGTLDCLFSGPCMNVAQGIGFHRANWGAGQRMFNVYDGPAYEDYNAFLNIKTTLCQSPADCIYTGVPGVRYYTQPPDKGKPPYLPHAAIGWKQPNGFYYPVAFNSSNLYFNNVDIRHYVISPVFVRGSYMTDGTKFTSLFSGYPTPSLPTPPNDPRLPPNSTGIFNGFTDIDRQTVLVDDDGSLTGFSGTVSVNDDPYFGGPIQAAECLANVGVLPKIACGGANETLPPAPPSARTSPYEYLTTVIYPDCATLGNDKDTACGSEKDTVESPKDSKRYTANVGRGGAWSKDCTGPYCFGVPIYRQYLTDGSATSTTREWQKWTQLGCDKSPDAPKCNFPFIRMAGTATWQRSVLTANNGKYYIDTTHPKDQIGAFEGQNDTIDLGSAADSTASYVDCNIRTSGPCQQRSVNVFLPNQTYYVFFVYATNRVKQTYQIYVGKDFQTSSMQGVLMHPDTINFDKTVFSLPGTIFTTRMINRAGDTNPTNGPLEILEVAVDLTGIANDGSTTINGQKYSFNPKLPGRTETCRPKAFCSADSSTGSCGCGLKDDPRLLLNPKLADICEKTCKNWAQRQIDCPDEGCLGFSFTLPGTFAADGQNKRPKVAAFPSAAGSPWLKMFTGATVPAGVCTYTDAQTPGLPGCPVPNIADLDGLPQ
ncbi:MAG: hypothetical protein JSS43_22165 [Proteobacteria bacterium]|nr:hypothetical protein [Pseudomonadota bacterium]